MHSSPDQQGVTWGITWNSRLIPDHIYSSALILTEFLSFRLFSPPDRFDLAIDPVL